MSQDFTTPLTARQVLGYWIITFVVAGAASTVAIALTGYSGAGSADVPTWVLGVGAISMWAVFLSILPRRLAKDSEKSLRSFFRWFCLRDVYVGIPLGVASQLVLVNIVNWPLSQLFPDTFSFDEVSKRAEDLVNGAQGLGLVVLFFVVVVGAPVVEEIVYRGSLQNGLVSTMGERRGVAVTAVIFTAIHLVPVEYPGLLAFALVLGIARQKTGTLGLPIITHLAFNATGLLLVMML